MRACVHKQVQSDAPAAANSLSALSSELCRSLPEKPGRRPLSVFPLVSGIQRPFTLCRDAYPDYFGRTTQSNATVAFVWLALETTTA